MWKVHAFQCVDLGSSHETILSWPRQQVYHNESLAYAIIFLEPVALGAAGSAGARARCIVEHLRFLNE